MTQYLTMISPAAWWGLGAAIPAVLAEYLYRVLPGPWIQYWWLWTPIALSVSYCICQLVRTPQASLLDAFVIWALSTTLMRTMLTVFVLHDNVKGGTWFALGLLVMARVAQTYWGR